MFRYLGVSLGLALLLWVTPVLATEMPKEQLDKDYKDCIQSPHAQYSDEKWAAFCKCNIDSEKAQFTWEEYQKLASDLSSATLADQDSLNKFKGIAASCSAKTLQP